MYSSSLIRSITPWGTFSLFSNFVTMAATFMARLISLPNDYPFDLPKGTQLSLL